MGTVMHTMWGLGPRNQVNCVRIMNSRFQSVGAMALIAFDCAYNQTYYVHMNARQVLQALKADGWMEVRSKGSHLQLKHPSKPGLVTLPRHGARDLKPGTLASIERQAGLKFRRR